jgi:uncharacterized membrane protein YdjX (TVP38/TMEM64 family)
VETLLEEQPGTPSPGILFAVLGVAMSVQAPVRPPVTAKSRPSRLRAATVALLVLGSVAALVLLARSDAASSFLEWIPTLGAWGPVIVAAAYVPATILFLPGSVLTLGAGFLFGVVHGTVAVSIGSTLGSAASFLLGRTLLRSWVEAKVERNPKFRAIDRAVAENGFKVVLLTRLSPVFPYNLLGYAFGVTRVGFRDYVIASWLGMLPGTVTYVYLGSALRSVSEVLSGKVEGGPAREALFALGLIATIAVTAVVTRAARRAIREAAPEVER